MVKMIDNEMLDDINNGEIVLGETPQEEENIEEVHYGSDDDEDGNAWESLLIRAYNDY
jgi:predicted lactoylglutathione lyase